MQRSILIDVQNLFYSARSIYNSRVNYVTLMQFLTLGCTNFCAKAYLVNQPNNSDSKFKQLLRNLSVRLMTKNLSRYHSGKKKGNFDVEIATDAIEFAAYSDELYFVMGDGDLVYSIEYIKALYPGCKIIVASFKGSTSRKLQEVAQGFIPLDNRAFLL